MYFVNEIFVSLQGEGWWTGTPMVFLRFAGCNLRCPFCDTAHTTPSTPMTLDELLNAVLETGSVRRICITGGEPGLQVDGALVEGLHAAGFTIHIETNGTRPLPEGIDWITLSPKSDFVPDAGVVLRRADELKLVFTGAVKGEISPRASLGRNDNAPDRWLEFPAEHHFLQPCYDAAAETSNTAETVAYILSHPSWRLSLQTHRLLGLR